MRAILRKRIDILSFVVVALALVVWAMFEQHAIIIPGDLVFKPDGFGIGGQILSVYDTTPTTHIVSIPPLIVYGNLVIEGECGREMPKNLIVYGNLILRGDEISKLPANLFVGGNLVLNHTSITSLPEGLEIGSLDLKNTSVNELPKRMVVHENLDLGGRPINSLPEDLEVGGCLTISGTDIITIPKKAIIGSIRF